MPKPNLNPLLYPSPKNTINEQALLSQLESELANAEDLHDLESTVLNLSDYLQAVQMVVKHTFDHSIWVKAEIRNLSSKGGHYYLELAEKDETGKVIASCRGTLWRFKADRVLNKFHRITGSQLTRDITVLIKVVANMHPLYGFSLNIEDIDPSYTLGDLAKQYSAMVERLTGEGLIHAQQTLSNPFDIEHAIVIAPENAAGLGDFRAEADKLAKHNACHFHYHSATFQGNHAPKEIRQVLVEAMAKFEKNHAKLPDLLIIIRGGGAVGDLAYLNDYELAALVAEQPVPVWVGIGHERDKVILDEVAHTSFDTPSKVIAAIVNQLLHITQNTRQNFSQIQQLSQSHLTTAHNNSLREFESTKTLAKYLLNDTNSQATHSYNNIRHFAKQQLNLSKQYSQQQLQIVRQLSQQSLKLVNLDSKQRLAQIRKSGQQQLTQGQLITQHLRELILLRNPENLLQQGYTIVKDEKTGKMITSKKLLIDKQSVAIQFKDGVAKANIQLTKI